MHDSGENPEPQVRIAVFAGMAELAGRRLIELPWCGGTVADLRRILAAAHPKLEALLARSAVAIGNRYATDGEQVGAGADVAIIPPVSGG